MQLPSSPTTSPVNRPRPIILLLSSNPSSSSPPSPSLSLPPSLIIKIPPSRSPSPSNGCRQGFPSPSLSSPIRAPTGARETPIQSNPGGPQMSPIRVSQELQEIHSRGNQEAKSRESGKEILDPGMESLQTGDDANPNPSPRGNGDRNYAIHERPPSGTLHHRKTNDPGSRGKGSRVSENLCPKGILPTPASHNGDPRTLIDGAANAIRSGTLNQIGESQKRKNPPRSSRPKSASEHLGKYPDR